VEDNFVEEGNLMDKLEGQAVRSLEVLLDYSLQVVFCHWDPFLYLIMRYR
jgi:hypothetical protein